MKSLKNILTISLISLSNCVFAQEGYIQNLSIIPENPTSNDEVMLICKYTLPQSQCRLDTFTITTNNNEMNIIANHDMGAALSPCRDKYDTINLGILAAGDYTLRYSLLAFSGTVFRGSDTGYLNFTVSETSSIIDKSFVQRISVHPNPATEELFISTKSEDTYKVEVYNVLGKKRYENSFTKNLSIDVSAIPRGVYFVKSINTTNNTQTITKIIIQ